MKRTTTLAAVALFLCALSASAGTINFIDPSWIRHNSGEQYLAIWGSGLGQAVVFDGPGGRHQLNANWSDATHLLVWLPLPVSHNPGWYNIQVLGGTGASNIVQLEVRGVKNLPLTLIVPDFLRVQPLTREGVNVRYDVLAVGGEDPQPIVRCEPKSDSFFKMGTTRVDCIADNRYGERAQASFDVNVIDEVPPIVKVPKSIQVQAESKYGARVEFEKAWAYDEIWGDVEASCSHQSGDMFPVGRNTVGCQATDLDGNVGFNTFTVEVLGEVKWYELTINVPDPPIFVDARDREGAKVEYKVTVEGGDDREPELDCLPKSESLFPIGETTVQCTALDRFGMRGANSFVVTVVDPDGPVIERLSASHEKLTPADGRLVEVRIEATAFDELDPAPVCMVWGVSSNENINLGDFDNPKTYDWNITGPLSIELRAEVKGKVRNYDVWVGCDDFYGNRTNGTVRVIVPYDGSGVTIAPAPPKRRSTRP